MATTAIIRGGEEKLLWATVHHPRNIHVHYPGVLEPKEGFEAQHQLLVARVVEPVGDIVTERDNTGI